MNNFGHPEAEIDKLAETGTTPTGGEAARQRHPSGGFNRARRQGARGVNGTGGASRCADKASVNAQQPASMAAEAQRQAASPPQP